MLAIIALNLIAIVALTVLSFAVHVLFSPWLCLAVIGDLAWVSSIATLPPVAVAGRAGATTGSLEGGVASDRRARARVATAGAPLLFGQEVDRPTMKR